MAKNKSIVKNILFYNIITSISIVIIFTFLYTLFNAIENKKRVEEYSVTTGKTAVTSLDIISENCLNTVAKIEYDKNMQKLLFEERTYGKTTLQAKQEIRDIIDSSIALNMPFMGFAISDAKETVHQSTSFLIEQKIIDQAIVLLEDEYTSFFLYNDSPYIYIAQKFYVSAPDGIEQTDLLYYSVGLLDKHIFLNGVLPPETAWKYGVNVYYGEQALWKSSHKTGRLFQAKNRFIVEVISPSFLFLSVPSNNPISYIVILLLIGIITVIIGYLNNRSITKPIGQLSEFCEKIPHQSKQIPVNKLRGTELTEIGIKINDIIEKLEQSKNELVQKEKILFDIQLEAQQLALNMLYNQINSHFLYNTLSNIRGMALKERNQNIADSLHLLVKYFRYCSNQNNCIIIREELNALDVYLKIQTMRLSEDKFSYTITCDETLKDKMILRMILQPLVENCFTHGFKQKNTDCKISISIEKYGNDRIKILVCDNGDGCPPQVVDLINRQLLVPSSGLGKIGIHNIRKRLQLFDSEYSLHIESSPNGTTVALILKY